MRYIFRRLSAFFVIRFCDQILSADFVHSELFKYFYRATPPVDETLILTDLGNIAEKNAKYHILDGTYAPPPTGTNQSMLELIEELGMPNSVCAKGPVSTSITPAEHHQGWK
jgi:hypothetical protein